MVFVVWYHLARCQDTEIFLQRSCIVNYVYTGELEVEQLGDALVVAVSFMFDPVQPVQIKPQSVVQTLHISRIRSVLRV